MELLILPYVRLIQQHYPELKGGRFNSREGLELLMRSEFRQSHWMNIAEFVGSFKRRLEQFEGLLCDQHIKSLTFSCHLNTIRVKFTL